jgi:NAD(P)-dependent dehydrogenase (short-subunit alcohol dehydrogenase family)
MLLEGKVAIITGIGPGLGQELAYAFAREGASVGICCRREGELERVASEIRSTGARVVAVPTDVTDRAACKRLADATVEAFGRVDALVNSAYNPGEFTLFEDADLETWRAPLEVNLFGTLQMTLEVVPHMKVAGGGAIVNINSMIHKKPMPYQASYATSKGALESATKMLAKELGAHKIRVNSVFMGWMWGPPVEGYVSMTAQAQGVAPEVVIAGITKDIALGIIPDDADCANAVAFLCSDYARVITGAGLDVNGGEWMP